MRIKLDELFQRETEKRALLRKEEAPSNELDWIQFELV